MPTLKERFAKWKDTRSTWQKAGDVVFLILLVLLIIPGPRKVIATAVNKVVLNVKNPSIRSEDKQVELIDMDFHWVLANGQGTPFYLSDLRDQVIFLNFWATWCPPCVAELPEIQRAYEKYGHEVAFILVSNQQPEEVEDFMEKNGYNLPVFYPGTAIPDAFQSTSIPTTFIISREGKIVTRKTGAVNWDSRAAERIFEELLR